LLYSLAGHNKKEGQNMSFLTIVDRLVIPALIAVLLAGGMAGIALGCALVLRSEATLRFISRMNRWVATKAALEPLDAPRNVEPAGGLGQRRPLFGALLVAGGGLAVYFLLTRLEFRVSYVPGIDVKRLYFSAVALQTMKWVLVTGGAFALVVGILMIVSPERLGVFERRLNQWRSVQPLVAADEKMHMPLEPRVEAYPRAAGWIIGCASLVVTLAMSGLLLARIH
jgi:hypothetical protein